MAPIAADHQIGAYVERAFRCRGMHAGNAASLLDQSGRLGLHQQVKARVALPVLRQEIEKIPLRHHGDKLAARREVAEIDEVELQPAECAADRARLLMRQLEE